MKSVAETALQGRTFDSPVGPLVLAVNGSELTHLLFERRDSGPAVMAPAGDGAALLGETERQLREYFSGRRREFDLPLRPMGTEFQRAVWSALREIPWGETVSYAELAGRIGRPRAVRATGAANGANPISIIVPCHRVIASSGKLAGYGGGLAVKKWLLEMEAGRKN